MPYVLVAGFAYEIDYEEVDEFKDSLRTAQREGVPLAEPLFSRANDRDEGREVGWIRISPNETVAVVDEPPTNFPVL